MKHYFSVVIATKNRLDDLKAVIPAFLEQDYDNKEIIVVDNASTDGTGDYISTEYPTVKYIFLPDNITILAQNLGIYHAKGDIIWRTDSDSHPIDKDFFSKINNYLNEHPHVDILSSDQLNPDGSYWNWYQPDKVKYYVSESEGYIAETFLGSGAAIKKEVFNKIGGYWEFGMEEKDFSTRARLEGFELRYKPGWDLIHYASSSERNNQERWINIARQYLRYVWKYESISMCIGFTILYVPLQLIQGIYWRVGFLAFFEGIFTFKATIVRTLRKERFKLNSDQRLLLRNSGTEISRVLKDYKYNLRRMFAGKK